MGRSVETLIMYACRHVFFNFFPRCPSTLKRVTDIDETRTSSLSFKWRIYVIGCLYILNWNFYLLLIYPLFMHLVLKVSLVISFGQMYRRILSFIISQVNRTFCKCPNYLWTRSYDFSLALSTEIFVSDFPFFGRLINLEVDGWPSIRNLICTRHPGGS